MPLLRYLPALLLLTASPACSPDNSGGNPATSPAATSPAATAAPDTAAVRQAGAYYQTVIGEPVFIDSSAYYYQPVEVGVKKGGRNLRDRISLSSDGSSYEHYGQTFNLLFTHQPDHATHLLLPHGRFLVTEVNSAARPAARYPFVFCTLVTQDFNRDGQLTTADASALYVADRNGRNLRQLPAPAGTQVEKLLVLPKVPTLLVMLRQDTNHDLVFDTEDARLWLRYDLRHLDAGPQPHPQPDVQAQLQQQLIEFNSYLVPAR